MKLQQTLMLAALSLAAGAAQAQTVVSRGVGLSHDCFIYAKVGNDPRAGVDVCNQSLAREVLNHKDRAATHDNRGVMQDALGNTDEALADFNAAIRLDPALGDPHVNLGSMLIKKRQYEEALTHINTGLGLGMSFAHIGYYDRAVAEQMLGRYKEAYYDYKKVLEIEPNFTRADERLKDFTVTRIPARNPG